MDNMFESILESNPRESEHEEIKERETEVIMGTYSKETFENLSKTGGETFDPSGSDLDPFGAAAASNATSIKNSIVDSNMMSITSQEMSMKSAKMGVNQSETTFADLTEVEGEDDDLFGGLEQDDEEKDEKK